MNAKQQQLEHFAYVLETLADDPDCEDPDARSRILKACANGMREAALGHARYEALRLLNATQYAEMFRRSIAGERFDDMVDELVRKNNETQ